MACCLPRLTAGTFSICAVDPATGTAGVAVASRAIAVGALVPYAEPGSGAIATQAFVTPLYGTRGLELLRKKVPPSDVIRRLTQEDITVTADEPRVVNLYRAEGLTDEGVDFLRDPQTGDILWFTRRIRQVGIVDHEGRAACYDGARLPPEAASLAGDGFACQGNRLASERVVTAMADAFCRARSQGQTMLRCLLATLKAGEAEGGDRRGKRSAAVLVVRERGHWSGTDRFCDVRVDDDGDPVTRLAAIALQYEEG